MKGKTIANIKDILDSGNVDEEILIKLKSDQRKGVQKLIKSYKNKQRKLRLLEKQYDQICSIERSLYEQGLTNIAGIDEAGRGPLAGPVVAAAVVLPKDFKLLGLTDSKQLSERSRNEFYEIIKSDAIAYSVSIIGNQTIDQINIFAATQKAMRSALAKLNVTIDHVLIDAVNLDPLPYPSDVLIKGDQKSVSIAAASILAKVTRDQFMMEIHEQYPMYHFNTHKGYGTKRHIEKLRKYGVTPFHRKSFAPVRNAIK